jgi:hypothetical protein
VHNYTPLAKGVGLLADAEGLGLNATQEAVRATSVNRLGRLMEAGRFRWSESPITTWKGSIINGHHRFIAAKITGNLDKLQSATHPSPRLGEMFYQPTVPWSKVIVR